MFRKRITQLVWLAFAGIGTAAATGISINSQDSGPVGSDVVVRVSVDTDGATLQGADVFLIFDSSKLQFQGVFLNSFAQNNGFAEEHVLSGGNSLHVTLFTGTPPPLVDGDHEVLWVLYHVLANGSSSLHLTGDCELNGSAPNTLTDGGVTAGAASVAFSITDQASGAPAPSAAQNVSVPIFADPVGGLDSFDVTLEFNPNVIVATGVTTSLPHFSLVSNLSTPGRVTLGLFFDGSGSNAISGSMPIASVQFHVVGSVGAETPLDLVTATSDDGVTTSLDDGFFRICNDGDNDGVTACATSPDDCDDSRATIYPGAPQICDGFNDDCNLGPPSPAPAAEVDNDGDTYVECSPWVGAGGTSGGDCNDSRSDVHPLALETCDGTDNDCDGLLNNGAANASCNDSNICTTDACSALGSCGFTPSGSCGISGTVSYYRTAAGGGSEPSAKGVPGESLSISGTVSGSASSGAGGGWSFSPVMGSIVVSANPLLDSSNQEAISSTDATRVAQAVVGLYILTSKQRQAGDVSDNGTISSFDASLIGQYAVALLSPVGAGAGSHFPVSSHHASDWSFDPTSRSYPSVSGSISGSNFSALLYGDVTGNWDVGGTELVTHQGPRPAQIEPVLHRDAPAIVSLAAPPLALGGDRFKLTLALQNADGIQSIDLNAHRQAGFQLLSAQVIGLASEYQLMTNSIDDLFLGAMFSAVPMSGSGPFLELIVRAPGGPSSLSGLIDLSANEGGIPLTWGRSQQMATQATRP